MQAYDCATLANGVLFGTQQEELKTLEAFGRYKGIKDGIEHVTKICDLH